jgi:hypothetical protein
MNAISVAEIGVRDGDFSRILLSGGNIKKFWAIDCWDEYITAAQNDVGWPREKVKKSYDTFVNRYGGDERVEIIKKLSSEAHKQIPDGSLDLVYLDGEHTKPAAKQDLENYWPKLCDGGIMSGHDYIRCWFKGIEFDVKGAVEDFVRERGLFIHITNEPRFKSFYIIKR